MLKSDDYHCEVCDNIFEHSVVNKDLPKTTKCPECGKTALRTYGANIIIPRSFKAV